jgi:exosome complex RNA-binding protein Rrp42 (RNase PH superfamily)
MNLGSSWNHGHYCSAEVVSVVMLMQGPGRADGRAWNQFRPMFMDVGMISQVRQ